MITLEMYKDQIDEYFDNTPPSEIIKHFEELGYEFEPIDTPDVDDMNFNPENATKEDTTLTHFASEKALAKDWSSSVEDEARQDL